VIVLLTGVYVTYYGYYEIRLYFSGADADDPVIRAAGAVQSWLADRVDALGVWPLLAVILALASVSIVSILRRRG